MFHAADKANQNLFNTAFLSILLVPYYFSFLHNIKKWLQKYHTSKILQCLKLGGDYMIPVDRDEILSRFAEIPAVL